MSERTERKPTFTDAIAAIEEATIEDVRARIEALPRYALLPSLVALPYIGLDSDGELLSRKAVLEALELPRWLEALP